MATLKKLKKETTDYFIKNDWMPTEFDKSINDISRQKIVAMKKEYGECWLGKYNLYDKEHTQPYKMIEYTGQMVYNFEYAFILPKHDRTLEIMIDKRDKSPFISSKHDFLMIEEISNRIEKLNGVALIWS